jgi:hypothetical protein
MQNSDQEVQDYVGRRVRRALGLLALRRIREGVDEVEADLAAEKRARRLAILLLLALVALVALLIAWPPAARWINTLIT